MTLLEDDLQDLAVDTAKAVEELRLAEAHLSRRRQTACGPSDTDRMAMRFILESADEGQEITPGAIAEHLGMPSASVTALLDRLGRGEMIDVRPHPSDKRKRLVVPIDRSDDPDVIDPLTATIRNLSSGPVRSGGDADQRLPAQDHRRSQAGMPAVAARINRGAGRHRPR